MAITIVWEAKLRKFFLISAMLVASSFACVAFSGAAEAQSGAPLANSCRDYGVKMQFICGVHNAEDLAQVPGTSWIIGSGLATPGQPGSGGLVIVDTRSHTAAKAVINVAANPQPPFLGCPGPLNLSAFSAHGLNISRLAAGRLRLFVVGHGGREATEIFDVATQGSSAPKITWTGCIPAPPDSSYMNAVVGLADGRVISSQFLFGQAQMKDIFQAKITGAVYIWSPGGEYKMLPGTELAGANGVAVTPDDKYLFVAATGTGVVSRYELADTQKTPTIIHTGFRTDNIHWGPNGRLLLAGPAFRGTVLDPSCDPVVSSACAGGTPVVAELNPVTLKLKEIYHGPAEPDLQYLSTGIIVGNTLWFGTYAADHIGYADLKH